MKGDDSISRQAAINMLYERIRANGYSNTALVSELNRTIGYLMRLPSAQPEIIRCKDCKEYQSDWPTRYPNMHYCATIDGFMPENGFCNYAERM